MLWTSCEFLACELSATSGLHTQELRAGQVVIARGLQVSREQEKNASGRYVPTESQSRTVSFSEKLTSFQDVSDIQSLCDRFS
jgi:hypothetical protein